MAELAMPGLLQQPHKRFSIDADKFLVISGLEVDFRQADKAVIEHCLHTVRRSERWNRTEIAILKDGRNSVLGREGELALQLLR